jgi:hypothetical protein
MTCAIGFAMSKMQRVFLGSSEKTRRLRVSRVAALAAAWLCVSSACGPDSADKATDDVGRQPGIDTATARPTIGTDAAALAAAAAAAAAAKPASDAGRWDSQVVALQPDAGGHYGAASGRLALCARPGEDAVRDVFCADTPPVVTSLRELQERLALDVLPAALTEAQRAQLSESTVLDSAVFMGLSTALSGALVSPINPRVILLGGNTFMAFQRGVQHVELVSFDRVQSTLNFFLLSFEQACNQREHGCSPGDLFTPRIEADWLRVVLEDDEDLKNTPFDCRQCHQRGSDRAVLLMRELRGPWLHFFNPARDAGGGDANAYVNSPLVADYIRAKGNETYAGVAGDLAKFTGAGLFLQLAVTPAQPLVFESVDVLEERGVLESGDAGAPRRSPSWDRAYAAFKRGEQLALPHYDERPTDADKQARLSSAYARFRAGQLGADELPDLADIFPDDPHVRAELGLQAEPDATPSQALVQACGSCHNDMLDQSISRARFNIDLARMSRAELDLAMARIELSPTSTGAMPPPGVRQLGAEVRERLLAYLRDNVRSSDDDALLGRAARLGMVNNPSY